MYSTHTALLSSKVFYESTSIYLPLKVFSYESTFESTKVLSYFRTLT